MNNPLDKSKFFIGESIRGRLVVSVDETDPPVPAIDLLNSGLQLIIKKDFSDTDAEAIANLTIGNGITVVSSTSVLFECDYVIPGESTRNITAPSARNTSVDLYYEVNITYQGSTNSDVLETGKIKIETERVKTTFT